MHWVWDIFSDVIGEALRLGITIAGVGIPFLVLYFLLKKMGYAQVPFFKFGRTQRLGFQLDFGDGPWRIEPLEPAPPDGPPVKSRIEAPQWQQELMETWENEGQVQRQPVPPGLNERQHRALRSYRWLVYGMVGALVAAAGFVWLQAMRGQAILWVAGLVLACGAAVAYTKLDPAQFD
jgi:hypothetical protein